MALLVALTALGLAIAAFCGRRGADAAHGAAARAVDASAPRKGARPGVAAEAPDDVLAYAAARRAAATPAGGASRSTPRALV